MTPNGKEPALFDSVREALVFALNAAVVDMPRPFMNKAMAEAPKRKLSKKVREALGIREEETRRMQLYPRAHFKGMDKAAQAGLILRQLEKLDLDQATCLKGRLTHAYDPCSCRAPCCSGQKRNPRWAEAVKLMCHILKETGDVLRQPGKRGLGTPPELRQIVVEAWFTQSACSLASIARQAGVTEVTARKHAECITTYLEQIEGEAWQNIAPILDQAGIVGEIT